MKLIWTDSSNKDFRILCSQLDKELGERYGQDQSDYDQHNTIENNKTVLVGYLQKRPIASGCIKQLDNKTSEIKRMYVIPEFRGKGFSKSVVQALELWARDLGCSRIILETGKGQPEAIGLYQKLDYQSTENYGPYIGMKNSVCMEKYI